MGKHLGQHARKHPGRYAEGYREGYAGKGRRRHRAGFFVLLSVVISVPK